MPQQSDAPVENDRFPAPNFDVRQFARTAEGSHRDRLGLQASRATPLDADTLRLLRYLQVIERGTMTHLRGVLVTATHKDARITAFLTTWAFEKYWLADALEQIILSHQPKGTEADRSPFRTPVERTIRESIYANIVGVPMIAVHMSLGTADQWITMAAYRRVDELAAHPQLTETIGEFLRIKERQLEFFEAQARFRLEESSPGRRITRRRLSSTPWPIGAQAEPRDETRFFYDRLFRPVPDLVADLDERIAGLPGQTGLAPIRKASRL